MLKIGAVSWRGKCARHPSFNPEDDGREAIRGECARCTALAEINECHRRMLTLMRGFVQPRPPKKLVSDAELQESLF